MGNGSGTSSGVPAAGVTGPGSGPGGESGLFDPAGVVGRGGTVSPMFGAGASGGGIGFFGFDAGTV